MENKEQSKKLEVGEKYLSISLLGQIKLAAFPNKNKSKSTDPDYIGNGIAVWIDKKGDKSPQQA